jgi:2-(1,2-epoxy-1,2-dihydrophenyl)acetyl-CoA isomerase
LAAGLWWRTAPHLAKDACNDSAMSISTPVAYSVADGVAHLELNRPESFNALDVPLARALTEAVGQASDDDDVKVVVLTGRGRAFCAGGDVKMMARAQDVSRAVQELATAAHQGILALYELTKPVVAAVHGSVAGGGLGLSCAADLMLAGRSTKFVSAYAGIAVTPDCSLSWALPRAIGARRALRVLLLNEPFSATEAMEWGLVTEVHEDDEVLEAGLALARKLAASPAAAALGRTRRLVRDSAERPLLDHLDVEALGIAASAATPESRQMVRSFAKS